MRERTPGRRYGEGRVAFLAMLEEVRAAVRAGRTLRAIYDEKGPRLGVSYVQFTRYANRFVLAAEHGPARIADPPAAAPAPSPIGAVGPAQQARSPEPRFVTLGEPRRFHHDAAAQDDDALF